MNADWNAFLASRGPAPGAAPDAAPGRTLLCDLTPATGLSRLSGEDTPGFLQGQLSCDVRPVASSTSTYGGYCTPQGRLLGIALLWHDGTDHYLELPADIHAGVMKRLSMFVLRAKVRIADVSADRIRFGIVGPDAMSLAREVFGRAPARVHTVDADPRATLLALPGDRLEVVTTTEQAGAAWEHLQALGAIAAPHPAWRLATIRAGIPVVAGPTQDQFVPQMANLELVGGVSFNKGCYAGQEIVARTQYLGRLKRRMYRARITASPPPAPGDALHGADLPGQACGMVVDAAPAGADVHEVLAVMQIASREAGDVHLRTPDGPALEFLPLPYAVPGGSAGPSA